MTRPEQEIYYCSHCEPGQDCPEPEHFLFELGPARHLFICVQCYRAIAYLVIEGLVQEAGAEVGQYLAKRALWMDGRFVGTRE